MSDVDSGPLILDTHAAVWYLQQDRRLSARAEAEIDRALAGGHAVHIPSICLVELVYLVDKRRIPSTVAERLDQILNDSSFGFRLAVLDQQVAAATREVPWKDVPDLPDRIIAATALALGYPLVTRDSKVRSANIQTIW